MALGPAVLIKTGRHDRDRLRRGDIVARRKIRLLDIAEKTPHRVWRQSNGVAPAHEVALFAVAGVRRGDLMRRAGIRL